MQVDRRAFLIAEKYIQWELLRATKTVEWNEIQEYIFATDTSKTSNAVLPWSNKTTVPKLCQIRDNLFANYMSSLFPKKKWLEWQGATEQDETLQKKQAIEAYIGWAIDRNEFYDEISKLVLDYIDYGNCFSCVEWIDDTFEPSLAKEQSNSSYLDNDGSTSTRIVGPPITDDKKNLPYKQVGFVGPAIRRISPLDIVFNPLAPSFVDTPKIIRSLVSVGEVREMMLRQSISDLEREEAEKIWEYLQYIRQWVFDNSTIGSNIQVKNRFFNISGFSSFTQYLQSGQAEILTFYGDMYDRNQKVFERNKVIKIVDRHVIISDINNPSYFGRAPIFHCGWRIRPDNLWAMGPLDNLVGMQYRIDHLENMKADVWDLTAYPPLKVKGYVDDFVWGPFEKILVGDDGDVELMSPQPQVLSANQEITYLQDQMELMAGSPKEAVGIRSPGEKTAYEVQQLQNAAGRVFQNKITQFERQQVENLLNGMLELARREIDTTTIRAIDDKNKVAVFMTLTPEDITGMGAIKPFAARHFAEQSQLVQNITQFFSSPAGQDPMVLQHFSSIELAEMWGHLFNLEQYNIIQPFVRLAEQSQAQMLQHIHQENSNDVINTPAGIKPGDHDTSLGPPAPDQGVPGQGPIIQ